ncbi:MAG: hypothetical protein LN589_05835 [Rickettsia endosymbiont of Eriopis connexa]|nr:hypothetical protein [Rickettsia endosymbiont of Eriopis connexa]
MTCLLAKSNTIKKAEEQGLSIYSRLNFIKVLNIGFGLENNKISFDSNFEEINKKFITLRYKTNLNVLQYTEFKLFYNWQFALNIV